MVIREGVSFSDLLPRGSKSMPVEDAIKDNCIEQHLKQSAKGTTHGSKQTNRTKQGIQIWGESNGEGGGGDEVDGCCKMVDGLPRYSPRTTWLVWLFF